ncbi:MAG: hypothetical protein C4527_12880 [Candidatus Omnitrophota bacterium]|jgi:predicted extracellular nuclease|nr:MAG: hypothetical protein C4527_12880 [Candidatus Omnitrophota bacterium]
MKSPHRFVIAATILLCLPVVSVFSQVITPIGDINSVDEQGLPTFPGLQTSDKYTIEGIVINEPTVFWGGSGERADFILFVQDETGGIQVYSGGWYGGGALTYADVPLQVGDRVRVTGLTGSFGGKTNINERHNKDQKFEIVNLGHVGEPTPMPITDLAAAIQFDHTRQTGGEYYQGRLVELQNVHIVDGVWENGGMLTVADPAGGTMQVELRYSTKIPDSPQPEGIFNIVGVFNQEDTETPHTEVYLLWPRSIADFKTGASAVENWNLLK